MQITKKIYNLQELNFLQNAKLKIGLLGGSFDPAHTGHKNISEQALKSYKLDYVIWLVAKQNPMKGKYSGDIFSRASKALAGLSNRRIIISTAEHDLDTNLTFETLKRLIARFPNIDFYWLMGIDSIQHFHQWHRYEQLAKLCKIIIFDRPVSTRLANYSRFLSKFKPVVAKTQSDNIIVCRGELCPQSSTLIHNSSKIN